MHGLDLLALAAAGLTQHQSQTHPTPSLPPPREPLPAFASFDEHYYPHHHLDAFQQQEDGQEILLRHQHQLYNTLLQAQSSSYPLQQPSLTQQQSSPLIHHSPQLEQPQPHYSLIHQSQPQHHTLTPRSQPPLIPQQQQQLPYALIHQSSPIQPQPTYPLIQQPKHLLPYPTQKQAEKILPQPPPYTHLQSCSHLAPLSNFARPPGMERKRSLSAVSPRTPRPSGQHICRHAGCGKTFARAYGLRVHQRKHSDEQPYPCKDANCGQRFKWRSSLRHHMRSRHKSI